MDEVVLIPSRGGVFEVELDGRMVYSKRATGHHGEPDQILSDLRAALTS